MTDEQSPRTDENDTQTMENLPQLFEGANSPQGDAGQEHTPPGLERRLRLEDLAEDLIDWGDLHDEIATESVEELSRSPSPSEGAMLVVSCRDPLVLRAALRVVKGKRPGLRWLEISEARVRDPRPSTAADENKAVGTPEVPPNISPLTLQDLCQSEVAHTTPSVVVVWAMSADTSAFLYFTRETEEELEHLRSALKSVKLSVIVLTHDDRLFISDGERSRRRELREVLRELSTFESLAAVKPVATIEKATLELSKLFQSLFTNNELLRFLRALQGDVEVKELVAGDDDVQFALNAADFLGRRGRITPDLFDRLLQKRRDRGADIGECRAVWANVKDWDKARLKELTIRKEQLESAQGKGYTLVDVVAIDAVDAILRPRLDPQLRRVFEEQRRDREWGESEEEIIDNLRGSIAEGELVREISQSSAAGEKKPTPEMLERLGPIGQIILFVAAFLPGLDPDEFEAVVQQLLQLEQEHLDALRGTEQTDNHASNDDVDDTEGGVAPAKVRPCSGSTSGDSMPQLWIKESDSFLERCGIEIQEVGPNERRSLRIAWKVRKYGKIWRDLLRQSRHYFVARQIDALKHFSFLTINVNEEEQVFDRILRLEIEQGKLAPARHVGRWVTSLGRLVKDLTGYLAASERALREEKAQGPTDEDLGRVLKYYEHMLRYERERRTVQRRLTQVLRAIQDVDPLRTFVSLFLVRLIQQGEGAAREWAHSIILGLADTKGFDDILWLGRLYSWGDKERTRPLVVQSVTRSCLSHNSERQQRAWGGVDGWLQDPSGDTRRGDLHILGRDVAIHMLVISTSFVSRPRELDGDLSAWFNDRGGDEVAAPLRWLLAPRIRDALEHEHHAAVHTCMQRVLFPPWPIDSSIAQATLRHFWSELNVRFADELAEVRDRKLQHWYPLMLAAMLVCWRFRLDHRINEPAPQTSGPELVAERILPLVPEPHRRRELIGVLATFRRTLRETWVTYRESNRSDLPNLKPPPKAIWPRFYEQMIDTLCALQLQVEAQVDNKERPHAGAH